MHLGTLLDFAWLVEDGPTGVVEHHFAAGQRWPPCCGDASRLAQFHVAALVFAAAALASGRCVSGRDKAKDHGQNHSHVGANSRLFGAPVNGCLGRLYGLSAGDGLSH